MNFWQKWTIQEESKHILLLIFFIFMNRGLGRKEIKFKMSVSRLFITFLTLFWCFEKYGRYWKNQNISFFFYFFGMCYFLKTWIGEERNWIQDECFSIVCTLYYIFIIILMFWQIWTILENIKTYYSSSSNFLFSSWILNRGRKKLNSRWALLDCMLHF